MLLLYYYYYYYIIILLYYYNNNYYQHNRWWMNRVYLPMVRHIIPTLICRMKPQSSAQYWLSCVTLIMFIILFALLVSDALANVYLVLHGKTYNRVEARANTNSSMKRKHGILFGDISGWSCVLYPIYVCEFREARISEATLKLNTVHTDCLTVHIRTCDRCVRREPATSQSIFAGSRWRRLFVRSGVQRRMYRVRCAVAAEIPEPHSRNPTLLVRILRSSGHADGSHWNDRHSRPGLQVV